MNWLTRLFRKRVTPKVTQPAVFRATGLEVTEAQWRNTPSLITAAMRITNTVEWVQILECLRTMSPARAELDLGTPLTERAVVQARIEGWNQCLATIKRLSMPIIEAPTIEETYDRKNLTELEEQ